MAVVAASDACAADLSKPSLSDSVCLCSGPIKAIAVDAASGEWIATASTQLLLWSVEEDTQESRPLNAHPAGVSLLAGSPDGKYLLSGSQVPHSATAAVSCASQRNCQSLLLCLLAAVCSACCLTPA